MYAICNTAKVVIAMFTYAQLLTLFGAMPDSLTLAICRHQHQMEAHSHCNKFANNEP